jgi:hypothetical protein
MPEIGVTLPLKEIYDGVVFPARPRLVPDQKAPPRKTGTLGARSPG